MGELIVLFAAAVT